MLYWVSYNQHVSFIDFFLIPHACRLYSRLTLSLPFFEIVMHNLNANTTELEVLSEQLLRESEPNLFPYVIVNLQNSTSPQSRSDDAEFP